MKSDTRRYLISAAGSLTAFAVGLFLLYGMDGAMETASKAKKRRLVSQGDQAPLRGMRMSPEDSARAMRAINSQVIGGAGAKAKRVLLSPLEFPAQGGAMFTYQVDAAPERKGALQDVAELKASLYKNFEQQGKGSDFEKILPLLLVKLDCRPALAVCAFDLKLRAPAGSVQAGDEENDGDAE